MIPVRGSSSGTAPARVGHILDGPSERRGRRKLSTVGEQVVPLSPVDRRRCPLASRLPPRRRGSSELSPCAAFEDGALPVGRPSCPGSLDDQEATARPGRRRSLGSATGPCDRMIDELPWRRGRRCGKVLFSEPPDPSEVPQSGRPFRVRRRLDRRREANDLNDLGALSVALPYCDIVVTEKQWRLLADQAASPIGTTPWSWTPWAACRNTWCDAESGYRAAGWR